MEGILYFNLNTSENVIQATTHKIPSEIIKQYSKAYKKKKEKSEFEELELRELRIHSDGSILLVREQYYLVVTTTYSQNGGSSTRVTYYYNDLLVTKINANGQLAWMKKLPKKQRGSRGQGGMSFK